MDFIFSLLVGKGIDPGLKASLHLFPEAENWVLLLAEYSSRIQQFFPAESLPMPR